jgi:hypothetical protein
MAQTTVRAPRSRGDGAIGTLRQAGAIEESLTSIDGGAVGIGQESAAGRFWPGLRRGRRCRAG